MKRLIILFLVLATNITYCQNAKEIAKKSLPSTVSLVMEDGYKQPLSLGSGFIVEGNKVITNLHVIEGAKYGYVLENGNSKKHKISGYFAIDKQNDLAILSVPTLTQTAISLSDKPMPEIGEKIYAIGNPKGLSGTISEGIVSGIRNLENKNLIQITAPISPGSSGGPVIDNKGDVIGVAVGTLSSGQNLNFAIPTSSVKTLLEKQSSTITKLNINKGTTSKKTTNDEVVVKEGVQIINIEWEKLDYSIPELYRGNSNLEGFSIKNNLPYTIENIKLLLILKNSRGEPIDYEEREECRYDVIRPFLSKYIQTRSRHSRLYERKSKYEKIEIRVLDFKIVED